MEPMLAMIDSNIRLADNTGLLTKPAHDKHKTAELSTWSVIVVYLYVSNLAVMLVLGL